MTEVRVRNESPGDVPAVRRVLCSAFPTGAEAALVDALRGRTDPQIALVAESGDGEVVGHILFTPVEIRSPESDSRAIGLAPMAVAPAWQRRGVGEALVEAGLAACRALGESLVVVLGHPTYYPRFGFRPACDAGLYYGAPGPNEAFLICELKEGALRGRRGEVRYHAAFDAL